MSFKFLSKVKEPKNLLTAFFGLIFLGILSVNIFFHPEIKDAKAAIPQGFQKLTVKSGLNEPTVLRFSPDGRVFIAEKAGIVKVFSSMASTTPTVVADLRTEVFNYWDKGLLGMALDPNFLTNPYIYLLYTLDGKIGQNPPVFNDACADPNGAGCLVASRLVRITISGNTMVAGSKKVLIEDWCQQYPSHSTGSLQFGEDGALYVSAGDGGSFTFADSGQNGNPCGDPINEGGALRSQDLQTAGDPVGLNGTVLRVDPATGNALPTNPLFGGSKSDDDRIVAYGLRNPFKMAYNPFDKNLYVGDVGWETWEEINKVPTTYSGPVASPTPLPSASGTQQTQYLSDLNYTVVANGYGPVEKDKSNGGNLAGDGKPLKLNGVTFAKGLGVHANSEITYPLNNCSSFNVVVGADDEDAGTIIFQVYDGATKLYDSGLMNHNDVRKTVAVNLAGKTKLRLVVTDGGNGVASDHADWADAKLTCGGSTPSPSQALVSPNTVKNFGWPCFEGNFRQPRYEASNLPICQNLYSQTNPFVLPFYNYNHNNGSASLSGIAIYPGGNYPSVYKGALFFTDYSTGWLKVMMPGADGLPNPSNVQNFIDGGLTGVDLVAGPGGDIYMADLIRGEINRFQYFSNNQPPVARITTNTTSGSAPLTVQFSGATSSDADPNENLRYSWDLNGDGIFEDSIQTNITYTYTNGGTYVVSLKVTDNVGAESVATVTITVNNTPPVAKINTPVDGTVVKVGDTITFNGSATDAESGNLPASSLSWKTILHHCAPNNPNDCHQHPIQDYVGTAGASFVVPDHESPSKIEIRLTATDPGGLQNTKSVLLPMQPAGSPAPSLSPSPSPVGNVTKFLSDLAYTVVANGYGPAEKDKSNGGNLAGDGKTLTINGVTFAKGLGVHANSEITYPLNNCSSFNAVVGADSEDSGTIIFQVFGGPTKLFDSGFMNHNTLRQNVAVNLTGQTQLKLVVTDSGNGVAGDHADWADAKITCAN